ncbi:MAG: TolB family protein [Burkholderiales bacterium]
MNHSHRFALALVACALAACDAATKEDAAAVNAPGPPAPIFTNAERVAITGYEGDAMEPFVSHDGKYLFFNNSNASDVDTNLHYSERVDDVTFRYRGLLGGANSAELDGVASMDRNGAFYFISLRDAARTQVSIYRGTFANGALSGVEPVQGIAPTEFGMLDYDAAISPDGNELFYVEGVFVFLSVPFSGNIVVANRNGPGFTRASNTDEIMREVNAGAVAYAPAISQSGLEIFFNRIEGGTPVVYTATRSSTSTPFGTPRKIASIDGFAEGPALSPDEKSLYYHRLDGGRYMLHRVTRQ